MSEENRSRGSHQRRDGGKGNRNFSRHSDNRGGGRRFDRRDDRHQERRRFERRDGERRYDRDGERQFDRRDNRRGDRRDDRHQEGRRFDRNGDRRFDRRDGERRYDRDGERRFERHDDRRYNDRHHDGDRQFDRRDGERRDGGRRNFDRNNDRRNNRHDRNDRNGNNRYGNRNAQGSKSFYQGARQNSDGTISYPSQNPYTDRRPDEPVMPKGLEWSMLSKDEKERLRGLSKEHAENIGLHMLAAYALADDDPEWALQHAHWIAKQASRIDMAREVLAFLAYRQGDYKLALREFKTAFRMNGFLDYLPFMADCERGLGHPERAIELALSEDAKGLRGESKAEMFLVLAGAQGDMGHWDKAIDIVHTLGRSRGISGEYRMRAIQAEQNFLEQAGRQDEAAALDDLVEQLEDQYADFDIDEDEAVIDNDLEDVSDDILQGLGIDTDPSHYADDDDDTTDADDTNESENTADADDDNTVAVDDSTDDSTEETSTDEASTEDASTEDDSTEDSTANSQE